MCVCVCAVSWFSNNVCAVSNNVSLARRIAQKIAFVLTEGVHVLTDLVCALQLTNFSHCSLMIGDSSWPTCYGSLDRPGELHLPLVKAASDF